MTSDDMSETIRTFIAITLNSDIQKTLKEIQSHLRKTGADVKWVKPENIHLTVKFIGDTPPDKLLEIIKVLRTTTEKIKPFLFSLTHLGAFPKLEHPQVIWVGVESGKTEITRLAQTLENNLESLGFKKEKREFDAHVTLGRVRSGINRFALAKELKQFQIPKEISQSIDHVVFYKSTLTSQGPNYEVIEKAEFTVCPSKSTF